MRVVHSLGWYFPDTTGGTEVYVSQLVGELRKLGIESVVAAARDGRVADSYCHEGIEVFRYPANPNPSRDELRGLVPYEGVDQFASWLSEQRADVYHQHSVVGGCGVHHLMKAREQGLQTVVTIHLPSAICLRGTMMLHGREACDGLVETVRCGVCWGTSKGLMRPIAEVSSRVPQSLSGRLAQRSGVLPAVFAVSSLVESQKKQLRQLSMLADRTVAISQWLYDALVLNGFPKDKLVLCHSGGPVVNKTTIMPPRSIKADEPLRIGFFGRFTEVKGVDLLIRALKKVPAQRGVDLVIHGISGGPDERAYEQKVMLLAKSDPRIEFKDPVTPDQLRSALQSFDLIAIPSQWLETGPLIALEAHAAGVPILASNLGGLAERVRNGVDGLLVPASDEEAWANAINRLATNRELLDNLRKGIRPGRTMNDVAIEMQSVYESLSEQRTACLAL